MNIVDFDVKRDMNHITFIQTKKKALLRVLMKRDYESCFVRITSKLKN